MREIMGHFYLLRKWPLTLFILSVDVTIDFHDQPLKGFPIPFPGLTGKLFDLPFHTSPFHFPLNPSKFVSFGCIDIYQRKE